MSDKPKNIIFIMADQMSACQVGCYGSGVESTPTLDALAARGTRFSRCYATSPVCTPNRACLLTGRSPAVHGMIGNNFTLNPDTPTFAHVLGHHGYGVGGFGKFHQTPMAWDHPESYRHLGFAESIISEDPKWGAYLEWIRREHADHFDAALAVAWGAARCLPADPDPRYESDHVRACRERILAPRREAGPWPPVYTSPLPPELHQTTWITDISLDFMRTHRRTHADQPFVCMVSYVDPHAPYDPPKPYDAMFAPQDMPMPIHAAWREEGNAVLEQARTWLGFDRVAQDMEAIRQFRAYFHGSVRFIDDQISRIVSYVDEEGLWDDTVLVFTTDHGEMLGDHQLIAKGVRPYDAGIRVPLIVAGAGVSIGEDARLTCALDFFPTFCDWGAVDPQVRPPLEGKSFAAETDEKWDSVWVGFGPMESVLSRDGWRLTLFHAENSPHQLIHLREDPHEQCNLYGDPRHQGIRTRLLEELAWHATHVRTTPQYRNLPIQGESRYTPGKRSNQMQAPIPRYGDVCKTPEW